MPFKYKNASIARRLNIMEKKSESDWPAALAANCPAFGREKKWQTMIPLKLEGRILLS